MSEQDRKEIVDMAIHGAGSIMLTAYKYLGLKHGINGLLINDPTNERFAINFRAICNDVTEADDPIENSTLRSKLKERDELLELMAEQLESMDKSVNGVGQIRKLLTRYSNLKAK